MVAGPLGDSINLFARDLHRELSKEKGNLAYSPLSVSLALTMTLAGARGETAKEMATALHYDPADTSVHQEYSKLVHSLVSDPKNGAPELEIANRLWAEKTENVVPAFMNLARDEYRAPVEKLDFKHDAVGARLAINQWVKNATHARIPEVLPSGGVDDTTRIVLTNAMYLKARWATPFRVEMTRDDVFHVEGTTARRVKTMHAELAARFARTADAEVLELPYERGNGLELSMVIILPSKRTGLAKVEKEYTSIGLGPFIQQLKVEPKVVISLPRFATASKLELKRVLGALGMRLAFTNADFSGMIGKSSPTIRSVFHTSLVDTNETGTEAAAATAVSVAEVSEVVAPKVIFQADHPFLFVIRDARSGVILFAGRITSPS